MFEQYRTDITYYIVSLRYAIYLFLYCEFDF